MKKIRTPKGECSIVSRSNRLRLRVPKTIHPSGNQFEIALNMADSEAGRAIASQILADTQIDIYSGQFDPTLEKYRRKQLVKHLTVYDLWCRYVEYKQPTIKLTTLHYYKEIIGNKLRDCPQPIDRALDVRGWMLKNVSKSYAAKVLQHLSSAVDWGLKHGELTIVNNPYLGMSKEISPQTDAPPPDAFTNAEKETILNAFLTSHYYDYYYPFVYFLFLTGCRPSEAIGLRWDDINDDLTLINFTGSIVQIKSKAVRMDKSKTNRIRSFPINTELRDLLEACLAISREPKNLVFPSREKPGKPIDYINFSNRAWSKTVDPIIDRNTTPYACRDTFITEQIAKGTPSFVVAKWVDNSPVMIEKRYFDITAVSFTPQ